MQKEKINKIRGHAEFISASSTHAVVQEKQQQSRKFPNQLHNDGTYFNNNGGFTLIELLVVVLIIGILTAVAVPQYNKAVEKSRLTQQMVTVRALYNALEVYRMENGDYPPAKDGKPGTHNISYFNDILDIDIHTNQQISYYPSMFIGIAGFATGRISINWYLGGGPGNGIMTCEAHPTATAYEKNKNLCLSVCTDKTWRSWEHGEYCII